MMFADGKASKAETAALRELLTEAGAPFEPDEIDRRVSVTGFPVVTRRF